MVRVTLDGGVAVGADFATGFDHPLALEVAQNGGLLVGDYGSGRIVEIFSLG